MSFTNIWRSFGSDALFLACIVIPAGVVLVALRSWMLRRRGTDRPVLKAVLEALLIGYASGVALVTLTPQGDPGSYMAPPPGWQLWQSDLSYNPDRTQVLANFVLLAPLVVLSLARFRPQRPLATGLAISFAVPTAIEVTQAVFIPSRVPTVEDVIVGAAGCVAATIAMTLLRRTTSGSLFGEARPRGDARAGA